MKMRKKFSFLGILLALALSSCGVPATSSSEGSSGSGPSSEPSSQTPSGNLPDLGEPAVAFHYHRDDDEYQGWNLWIWPSGGNGDVYEFNYDDDYGKIAYYPISTWSSPNELCFIVRTNSWDKDPDGDRSVFFDTSVPDSKGIYHYYLYTGDSTIYDNPETPLEGIVKTARFVNTSKISVSASLGIKKVEIYEEETKIGEKENAKESATLSITLTDFNVDFNKVYNYKVTLANSKVKEGEIDMKSLYGTDEFNEAFAYDGELGAIYTKEATTFKVWSPFSSSIKLNLYEDGTPASKGGSDTKYKTVDMTKGEKGVFSATVNEDLEGKYYTYTVNNKVYSNKEVVDPYAKSAGVNGLRGMVVDFSKTNPEGWDEVNYLGYDRKELTVYETHVADVTSSSTWGGSASNQKLFKGMYETGTTYTEGNVTVKTGFDHIKELGVNAVQILPLFDQDNDELNMTFNWGYNPLNYNVVEGGYSSNPKDGYVRIKEFKELVKAYNKAGIEIIMDVVYNHVSSAESSNFEALVPGYYFRYNGTALSNGSGCGNETASDHYMFRKFMIDSTSFWLKEYKLDGFRFDLMGLHDIETMNLLTAEAKMINPATVIYGEPWTGGDTPLASAKQAKQSNAEKFEGYGQFNDQVRNALHGGVFDDTLKVMGWCDASANSKADTASKVRSGLIGITSGGTNDPNKTVNYVTCHDNRTLFDRIVATEAYDEEDDYEDIVKMIDVAHSVVFLSEGTSFMLAGEEFARTKGGDHNSYQSSYKVNELDYALKVKNMKLFENMKKYISLKQELELLHLNEEDLRTAATETLPKTVEFVTDETNNVIMMKIKFNNKELVVIHHNSTKKDIADTFDLAGYTLVFDSIYGSSKQLTSATPTERFETIVATK